MGVEVVFAAVGLWFMLLAVAAFVGGCIHWGTADETLVPVRRRSVDELLADMTWDWPGS